MHALPTWTLLAPCALLAAACDPPLGSGLFPGPAGVSAAGGGGRVLGPADVPAINAMVSNLTAEIAKASTDSDRESMVLEVAARDLACPRSAVVVVMTFDRRFGNSYSLRYLVEGCGMRALYGEDCAHMNACEYVLASRTTTKGLEPFAPVQVPSSSPAPALPRELTGFSVRLEPHIVGELVGDATIEQATAACEQRDAELVHALGWTVAEEPSQADLVARFGCTGHVQYETRGSAVRIRLPYDGTPSLVLLSGEHMVLTVAPGPTHLACESAAADKEADCFRRASATASARITAALAASPELKRLARQRRHGRS